ncbi:hypothetical protein HZA97_07350 [Candidatus Woesearchaeota archaeon]|nr:hypothetical protein [Candidatus Woesearchaeota archaeon]
MSSIEEVLSELKKGDLIKVRWKPLIRIYGRDTFVAKYLIHDPKREKVFVERTALDIFDMKFLATRIMPYHRIELIEKLEPPITYQKPETTNNNLTIRT